MFLLTPTDDIRLQALVDLCLPIISSDEIKGQIFLKDQFTQELANNNINYLIIGMRKVPKMHYQYVNKNWNEELGYFEKSVSLTETYQVIFDYYCLDGSSPSVLNVLGSIICDTIFPKSLAMQPRAFDTPENMTSANMLQGVLKQRYRMIVYMMCYNEYLIGKSYKTDVISIESTLNDDIISLLTINLN